MATLRELVTDDLRSREAIGMAEYGKRLSTQTDVDFLVEAYHEVLDQAMYLRALIARRDGLVTDE